MSYEEFLSEISKTASFRPKESVLPGRNGIVRWILDESQSFAQVQAIISAIIRERGCEYAMDLLHGAIDNLTGRWQEYRSGASKESVPPVAGDADQYTSSWLLNQAYDIIARVSPQTFAFPPVAIGAIAPGRADRGKNIVRLCWVRAGYSVRDAGTNVSAAEIIKSLQSQRSLALGIACTVSEARTELEVLLTLMENLGMDIPVVIGGIAVGPDYAMTMSRRQTIPIYYCRNLHEAVPVLQNALQRLPVVADYDRKAFRPETSSMISIQAIKHGFLVWELSPQDLVIDSQARAGCAGCITAKQTQCPLEKGWETVQSIESSRKFIDSFDTVYLIGAEIVDEADPTAVLTLWNRQTEFRKYFSLQPTYLFRFPTNCPFCFPHACAAELPHCRFPERYLGLHETYNINLQRTVENICGAMGPLIYSVLLVKETHSKEHIQHAERGTTK